MGPYAGVDCNLTLCPLQSRLQHIYHRQPYVRVDFIPQSGTTDLASVSGTRSFPKPAYEAHIIIRLKIITI
jgi:hypothetical protein